MTPVVLASGSPRRRELLRYICPVYEVVAADVDEMLPEGVEPDLAVSLLADKKAAFVQVLRPGCMVIGADTVVSIDGLILGKPRDEAEAERMLGTLSGREHRVYTGVSLRLEERIRVFTQCTRVWFYPLTGEEIAAYVRTGEPMDKAGAYGIQGWGSTLVERIDGDFYNVMGLPVARLRRAIAEMESVRE